MKNTVMKSIQFFSEYRQFCRFLPEGIRNLRVCDEKEASIGIVVTPWSATAVPWYAIVLTLLLHERGEKVCVLLDDMPFGRDRLLYWIQVRLIRQALNTIDMPFKSLSSYIIQEMGDTEIIYDLARLNSLHYMRGESNYHARERYEHNIAKQMQKSYARYSCFFENENVRKLIVPGGIWGNSGLASTLAIKYDVQLMTYDSGPKRMLFSIYGVAAQLKDIPHTFHEITQHANEKQYAIQEGIEQLKKRRIGQDMYDHFDQKSQKTDVQTGYYLMLLNSVWDSAALGLHTTYESMLAWIVDSIEWVLSNTNDTIVVRQHPAERDTKLNNTDRYEEVIGDKYVHNKRVVFITASENVNTYDLIESAKCILGFSSTSIVESVLLGKPAIIVSNTYYANLDIVFKANSKAEYYSLLKEAAQNTLKVTENMKNNAAVCNYISQSCNWIHTDLTPQNSDFKDWAHVENIETFFEDNLILEAILTNTPVSLLRHRKNFG